MELYHNNMSVCSQKVRLVLHKKSLKPGEHHLKLRTGDSHTPEYLALNPNGVVPTLIDRGEPIIESTVICEYLDDGCPEPPMRPRNALARAKMRLWTQIPDTGLHHACATISIAIAFGHQMEAQGDAQFKNRSRARPNTTRVSRARSSIIRTSRKVSGTTITWSQRWRASSTRQPGSPAANTAWQMPHCYLTSFASKTWRSPGFGRDGARRSAGGFSARRNGRTSAL